MEVIPVLIASCIRQKPEILKEFLESLDGLEKPEGYEYFFILSDLEEASRTILIDWCRGKPVETETMDFGDTYATDEDTHHWTPKLVSNVIEMKNRILEKARGYDGLLFVDSDTYLHPKTLTQLLSRGKDIITEISWTRWYANDPLGALPNAWFYHKYGFPRDGLDRLRNEPLIKVGGFGGLYLLSKKALMAYITPPKIFTSTWEGVSFSRTEGSPDDWGEDRFFAIRAKSLGFDLWCDTTIPSFHIYRLSDLPRLRGWKGGGFTESKAIPPIYGEDYEETWGKIDYQNKRVLDIGADIGSTADYFIRKGAKEVVAVEGGEEFYEKLEANAKDHPQIKPLFLWIDSPEKFTALINEHHPDIVKCDIEGGEVHLADVEDTVFRSVPEYLIETHGDAVHKRIQEKLENNNYDVIDVKPWGEQVKIVTARRHLKLVAMMLTYNDEGRYLKRGLDDLSQYVDEIVILDGGSTDKTVEICRGYPKVIMHQTAKPMIFGVDNEFLIREEMYHHALERKPDWVLVIDSDQMMEARFKDVIRDLMAAQHDWYSFCLCDMWSETQYRVDGSWSPNSTSRAWRHLFRVKPDASPEYLKEKEHCGDAPAYVINAPADKGLETNLRIRHYAYATPEGRKAKYEHHINGIYSWHAKTIMEPPTLKDWEEQPKPAEEAKRGGVLISVPNTGQIKTELVSVLLNIAMRNPQIVGVDLPQGMPVDSSRNNAVKRFLGSRFEWILPIDSDIVPPMDVVDRLLRHKKKIVSAVCWSSMGGEKGGEWEQDLLPYPTIMEKAEDGKGWRVDRKKLESPETLIQVDAVGMSCLLIHREVFEKMGGNWFRLSYSPDGMCNGGEDFAWCLKAKELGYEIWVDKSVQCGHYKTVDLLAINQVLAKTAQSHQKTPTP